MAENENVGELLTELEQVLSVLRHELGNPVHSMKTTLNVFMENMDQFDDDKKKAYVDRCLRLVARQERLVEAMKQYARFETGHPADLPFSDLWDWITALAVRRLNARDIRFYHDPDPGHCRVFADPKALGTVLEKILENAEEAVLKTADPEIALGAGRDGAGVEIRLEDNGPGVREEDLRRLVVPLFTTRPGRMGMGLAVARKLLAGMGGRLGVENRETRGTRVRAWLRCVTAETGG